MENVERKRKWVIISVFVIILTFVAIMISMTYQKKNEWNAFDLIEIAGESFNEQQTFAYTKTTLQKVKTQQEEILNGGIYEQFDVEIAKDQSFKVTYSDAIMEADNETITELEKATLYINQHTNYTDNLSYSFKVNELKLNQYELPKIVSFIAEEFENTKNNNNKQLQELKEVYKDGEYIITYKTRINDMSTAVSEYILYIDSESKQFKKIISKENYNGFEMTKTYQIDRSYVAPDTIKIPNDAQEILD